MLGATSVAIVLPLSHKETNNSCQVLCTLNMPGAEWLMTETDHDFFGVTVGL